MDSISSRCYGRAYLAKHVRMFEVMDYYDIMVLLASDRDYIPAFELLRKNGKYVITVGCRENHPVELINKSYLFLEIDNILKN